MNKYSFWRKAISFLLIPINILGLISPILTKAEVVPGSFSVSAECIEVYDKFNIYTLLIENGLGEIYTLINPLITPSIVSIPNTWAEGTTTYKVLTESDDLITWSYEIDGIPSETVFDKNTLPTCYTDPLITSTIIIDNGDAEAEDNILDLALSAESETLSPIVEMQLSLNPDFRKQGVIVENPFNPTIYYEDWIPYQESFEFGLPDEQGEYEVFVRFKDAQDRESQIFSSTIIYNSYEFRPELILEFSSDPLLGSSMSLNATLTNIGTVIGYKGKIELELPEGIEFKEVEVAKDIQIEPVMPSFVSPEKVIWESLVNLAPGEFYEIAFKLGFSSDNNYQIGDTVKVKGIGYLYESTDSEIFAKNTNNTQTEILPFRITTSGANSEKLTGEDTHIFSKQVQIQNNAFFDSNAEYSYTQINPETGEEETIIENQSVLVREFLSPGIKYLEGSQVISNLFSGVPVFNTFFGSDFDFEDIATDQQILEWSFSKLTGQNFESPVSINFDLAILHNERDNAGEYVGDVISQGTEYDSTTQIQVYYDTNNEDNKLFNTQKTSTLSAEYIKVHKSANKTVVNPGETVMFTINLESSDYYDFNSIEVEDLLPDGLEFVSSELAQISEDYPVVNADGTTDLSWVLPDLQHSSTYSFSYTAQLSNTYAEGSDIVANDYFKNSVQIHADWLDVVEVERSGDSLKTTSATVQTQTPNIKISVFDSKSGDWTDMLDVMPADQIKLKLELVFPEFVPTLDTQIFNSLPPYLDVVEGSENIIYLGEFEHAVSEFSHLEGLSFGDVTAGSTWTIEFDALLDNNLTSIKNGVLLRDLSKLSFQNSSDTIRLGNDYATLRVIEPNIQVSKQKTSGYLQAGDTVEVEVVISNDGLSTAYGVGFTDEFFSNSTVVENTLTDNGLCSISQTGSGFEVSECNINSGEDFIYSYQMLIADSVITKTDISSNFALVNYSNRDVSDTLEARIYAAEDFLTTWKGVEGALITDIRVTDTNNEDFPGLIINDTNRIVFSIKNVGGAPVYNLSEIHNNPIVSSPEISLESGPMYLLNGEEQPDLPAQLNPNKKLEIVYTYLTSENLIPGSNYLFNLSAEGQNLLDDPIRKDASVELSKDTDNDDYSEEVFPVMHLDYQAPIGNVQFRHPEVLEGEEVSAVNDFTNIEVVYSAIDIGEEGRNPAGVSTIRFSNDGFNWQLTDQLSEVDCPEVNLPAQAGGQLSNVSCNSWDGTELKLDFIYSSLYEGRHYRYAEVRDSNGNVAIIDNSIVYDVTSPGDDGNVWIGREEYDWSNPEYTNAIGNWVTYNITDNVNSSLNPGNILDPNDVAGIAKVRFSVNAGLTYSDWMEYSDGAIESFYQGFGGRVINAYDSITIYMQVQDLAGNLGAFTYSDDIIYVPSNPKATIIINNDEQYTKEPAIAVKVTSNIYPDFVADKIRFKYCNTECTEDNEWSGWQPYAENFIDLVNEPENSGNKRVYIQVMDSAGFISPEVYDQIVLDNTPPSGDISIASGWHRCNRHDYFRTLSIVDIADKNLDGSNGIGQVQYSYSLDGIVWTDSRDYPVTSTHDCRRPQIYVGNEPDAQIIYVKIQDALGNELTSQKFTLTDPELSRTVGSSGGEREYRVTGQINLNDGNVYTDSQNVSARLSVSLGDKAYMNTVTLYELDKSKWGGSSSSNDYINPQTLTFLGEGSHFQNYELSEGYGKKRVYAKFNGKRVVWAYDEIIFAPKYAAEYSNLDSTLDTLFTSTATTINLDLHNNGSLVWESNDIVPNPVNLSYHWYKVEEGEIEVPYIWDGVRTMLDNALSFDEGVEGIVLDVLTPSIPGQYVLKVDLVHEGVTWFSGLNVEMPEVEFIVDQNPDVAPTPQETSGQVLGDYIGEYGIGAAGECNEVYIDVCSNTFLTYIKNLHYDSVIDGNDDFDEDLTTFVPDKSMLRGQLAEWIIKAFNFPLYEGTRYTFDDVRYPRDSIYYDYIITIKSLGISRGFSDGEYKPARPITRGELATMIVRAMVKKGMTMDYSLPHSFTDIRNSVHEPSIAVLTNTIINGERIMRGTGSTIFGLNNWATRGQVTKVLDLARQFEPVAGEGTVVSTIGIKLYENSTELSSIVGEVDYVEKVKILAEREIDGERWIRVQTSSGEVGWTKSEYIYLPEGYSPPKDILSELYEPAHMCNDNEIGVYAESKWNSRLLKNISKYQNFNVIEVDGDWRKVVLVGRISGTGWIHKAYVCQDYADDSEQWNRLGFVTPTNGSVPITSIFGPRSDGFHYATDYGLACNTPIYAVQGGTVVNLSDNGVVEGNNSTKDIPVSYIVIEHDNGYLSYYFHLNKVDVNIGDPVFRGQYIGTSGNTGYLRGNPDDPIEDQGCHLHFEIHEKEENPTDIWDALFARNPIDVFNDIITPAVRNIIDTLKETFFGADITDEDIVNNIEDGGIGSKEGDDAWKYIVAYGELHITGGLKNEIDGSQAYLKDRIYKSCSDLWVQPLQNLSPNYIGKTTYDPNGVEGGLIYTPNKNQVFMIKGEMWERYKKVGGTCYYGRPTISVREKLSGCGENGYYQFFMNGAILQKENETAIAIYNGPIWNKHNQMEGIKNLGWPTRKEVIDGHVNIFYDDGHIWGYENEIVGTWAEGRDYGRCYITRSENIEIPFSVTAKWEPLSGVVRIDSDMTLKNRWGWFDVIKGDGNKYSSGKVWVVAHGWFPTPKGESWGEAELRELANTIAVNTAMGDTVLLLNWAQMSQAHASGCIPGGAADTQTNCGIGGPWESAKWIRPTAREVANRLREWGMTNELATTNLNFAGHSFGTYLSREVAYEMNGANEMIALDTASEILTFPYQLDGNGIRNDSLNYYNYFSSQFELSRSFVGKTSFAGNPVLSATANESYLIDFEGHGSLNKQHGWVVKAIESMFERGGFLQIENGKKFFDLPGKFVPAFALYHNQFDINHEGIAMLGNLDKAGDYEDTVKPQMVGFKVKGSTSRIDNCFGSENSSIEKNTIYGTGAKETIIGGIGECSAIYGGGGDDTIWGNNNSSRIEGGSGNDTLIGSLGRYLHGNRDKISGGSGSDEFIVLKSTDATEIYGGNNRYLEIEDFGDGNDRITLSSNWKGNYTVDNDGSIAEIFMRKDENSEYKLIATVRGIDIGAVTKEDLKRSKDNRIVFNFK